MSKAMADQKSTTLDIEQIINDVLSTIEREREREIIARRFGLFDRKETLEQIGELLGITRERVRQLEKAIITRLKAAATSDLPHIKRLDQTFDNQLKKMGKVARIADITPKLAAANSKIDQSRVSFLATLSPNLAVIDDNDHFFHAIGLASEHTEKKIRELVAKIIEAVENVGEPTSITVIAQKVGNSDQ